MVNIKVTILIVYRLCKKLSKKVEESRNAIVDRSEEEPYEITVVQKKSSIVTS